MTQFEYELTVNDEETPELETDPCPHCGKRIFTVEWTDKGQFVGFPEGKDENERTAELDDWYANLEVSRIHCDSCYTVLVE